MYSFFFTHPLIPKSRLKLKDLNKVQVELRLLFMIQRIKELLKLLLKKAVALDLTESWLANIESN